MSLHVQVVADDPLEGERLVAMLATEGVQACMLALDGNAPDVIVTFNQSVVEQVGTAPPGGLPDDRPVARVTIMPVGFTSRPSLDAESMRLALPSDCAARELALACRLLGEIVRLRREATERSSRTSPVDLALIDELTGLPNRRAWQAELDARLRLAGRDGGVCLAIIDLDHFKQVNTGWGHGVGDKLLVAMAEAVRHGVRPGDFVARLGGDEFVLLLSGLADEDVGSVVDRVRRGAPAFAARTAAHVVSCSAGFVVTRAGESSTAESLFAAADAALRRAKYAGRDVTMPAT